MRICEQVRELVCEQVCEQVCEWVPDQHFCRSISRPVCVSISKYLIVRQIPEFLIEWSYEHFHEQV